MKIFTRRSSELEKELKEIPASRYSRKYFLSEGNFKGFERLKKGGQPGAVFLRAVEYIPEDMVGPFLDIGCGRGELVVYLARLGKKTCGIDYSKDAIDICRETFKLERKSTQTLANFQLADCTNIPFKNNTFQCLFLLDIVEHLTPRQLELTLREANRVLERRGILIIHTNNKYFEKFTKLFVALFYQGMKVFFRPKKVLKETTSSPYEYLHVNYLSGAELTRHLEEVGFGTRIEYPKPKRKAELQDSLEYPEGARKRIFYNITWFLLNSPLLRFISPTFWIVARKTK